MKELVGVESLYTEAAQFAHTLKRDNAALVVALEGDLGAGKTTFVQGVARALGIKESVTSPTFVIQKTYPLQGSDFKQLVHIDAYRLKGAHELEVLEWKDAVADPSNLIFIEWPERVAGALPTNTRALHLEFIDEQTRGINYATV